MCLEVKTMAYKAIYRKWRPMVFEDIIGQSHITKTLKNQITENRVGHAYLFCGTRGTGKTTAAKIFARAVNCLTPKDGSPCNECEICKGILSGGIMDVSEIDAASNNGVDGIRELRDDTKYVTASAKYRVYIIDEVHMLSTSAFNALLKTLEEPPEHVIFILATTEPHQIPQTILSRCQRYDFRRIKPSEIILRLKEIAYGEGFEITDDAYALIARLGDGSMRDSISVLERVVSAHGSRITYENITETLGVVPIDAEFEMAKALLENDADKVFSVFGKIIDTGIDLNVFTDSLIAHFRNLLVCKVSSTPEELIDYSDDEIVKFKAVSATAPYEKLSYISDRLTEAKSNAKWVKSPRVVYESAFIKMCRPELDTSPESILARMSDMEEKLRNGSFTTVVKTEAPEMPSKNPEEKKPSGKLYCPIPPERLNASNPIVVTAKKWEKITAAVIKHNPHLASALLNVGMTIDDEGIILLYNRSTELGAYNIAASQLKNIIHQVSRACGVDLNIKIAFKDELEDCIIDFWALPESASVVPEPSDEDVSQVPDSDPLSGVMEHMGDFVDMVDDREFLTYERKKDEFSQSELEEEDDDREEFIEAGEMPEE